MIEVAISDLDFFQRKIKRLQEDNSLLNEELIRLRNRLRVAQDFEIKYSILLKSAEKEKENLKNYYEKKEQTNLQEQIYIKLKENNQKWEADMKQMQNNHRIETQLQLKNVKDQLKIKVAQLHNLKQKIQEIELFGFKTKKIENQNISLKEQIQEMRQFYEKQRVDQINKLRTILNNNYRQKIESERKKYQIVIENLENRLNSFETQKQEINCTVSDTTNKQLVSLKKIFQQKIKQHEIQLRQLSSMLDRKNEEIRQLLKQKSESDQQKRAQLAEKREYIDLIEDKMIEKQKQHDRQLLNLIERMNSVKQEQISQYKKQIKNLHQEIQRSNQLFNERILNHQNQVQAMIHKFQEEKKRLNEDKNVQRRKISELSMKMKEIEGERQMGETEMLINSLKDLDLKQDHIGNYQNGITFLERQLKKCQIKLQEKSRNVSKLYKEINTIRTESDKQIEEMKTAMKNQKKNLIEKVVLLQNENRDILDKLRKIERQERKRERQIHKEKHELQEQNRSLKQFNQELQRDYNRVIQNKKGVQSSYREERQKNFTCNTNVTTVKKEKWLELEKQKNELQIIFREKQQQLKLQYQQQVDERVNQLNKLKQQLEITNKENEILKRDNDKLMEQLEINKQNSKYAEYNKKISSLNLQIALTQNLYESLVKAKSRNPLSQHSIQSIGQIDIQSDHNEQDHHELFMSFHPSKK